MHEGSHLQFFFPNISICADGAECAQPFDVIIGSQAKAAKIELCNPRLEQDIKNSEDREN